MIEVEMVFDADMVSIVEEWFGEETVVQDDGRLIIKVVMPENNWLYGFLLSFGTGVEVIGPLHLRRTIAEIAEGIHKKYVP